MNLEAVLIEALEGHRAKLVAAVERAEAALESALTALYAWDEK